MSRGAARQSSASGIEPALRVLQRNLETTAWPSAARWFAATRSPYLGRDAGAPFDVIYIAPPQYQGLWLKALQQVDARPDLLAEDGLVIVQVFPKEWAEPVLQHLAVVDRRQYGSTALYFLGKD